MHRNRTWTLDPPEWRTQRNRLLPIEGGDGSTLNLDFTKGILDPRLNFSRLSTATFVNSSGYVEYAGANLMLQSNSFDTSPPWVSTNVTMSQFGTSPVGAAWKMLENLAAGSVHRMDPNSVPCTNNGVFTFSTYVKQGLGSRQVYFLVSDNATGEVKSKRINPVDGTLHGTEINGGSWSSATTTSESVGDGWYRLKLTVTKGGGTSVIWRLGMSDSSGNLGYNGDGSSFVCIAGCQINPGSTAQTYYPTTTAAYHAPRFDYSPTNIGEPMGLLIEGQGVNLLKSSEEFSIALGYGEQDILSRTTGTSPSNETAVGFYPTTASGYHRAASPYITGLSGAITVSIWYKRLNSNLRAGINANAMLNVGAVFDLNGSGSVVTLGGSAANKAATITAYPNDWYRVTVTGTRVTDSGLYFFMAGSTQTDFDGGTPFLGVASQGMLMWGAQLEAGSGASSYIPTGASQVTRNADLCYSAGSNFSSWFSDGPGTVVAVSDNVKPNTQHLIANFSDSTNNNYIRMGDNVGGGTNELLLTAVGAAVQGTPDSLYNPSLNTQYKTAYAWDANNFACVANGATVGVDNTGSVAGTGVITSVAIGTDFYQTSGPNDIYSKNGHIKSFTYFPSRLSNARLQQLTNPTYVAPTLDLNFLNMSSNTDLINSGLTFGRLSNATMVNASGFVVSAPSNLIINSVLAGGSTTSTALSNPTGWFTGVSGTSYRTGVVIASCNQWIQTANNQRPFITITIPQADLKPGVQYVASVYVDELSTGSNFDIIGAMLYYNAPTGTTVSSLQWVLPSGQTTGDGSGALTTGLLQLRFKLSVVGVSGFQIRLGIGTYNNATGAVIFSRPQVEQALSATSYIPNTSTVAPFYGPRFDYSPTNIGQKRGLLIEGQVTNIAALGAGSNSNTTFTMYNTGASPNFETLTLVQGIDGVNGTAASFTLSASGFLDSRYANSLTGAGSFTVTSGQLYTASFYHKVTRSGAPLAFNTRLIKDGGTIENPATSVDLPGPNGFTRRVITFTPTSSTYGVAFAYGSHQAGDIFQITGMQVELGSGASSYIPTGSGTVTRSGDACVMNDITALKYSTQKSSIYWRGIIHKQPTAYTTLIGFQATSDLPSLETFGNGLNFFTAARGPGLAGGGGNEVSRAFTLNSTIRYASSVNTLSNPIVSVNLNGSAGSVDKAGNGNMHAATRFVIGRQLTADYEATYPSVILEQIQYYPTTLLPHQLQALIA